MQLFHPWRRVHAVTDLSIPELVAANVRLILLDRDNTCVPRDTKVAPPDVIAWFDEAKKAGMALCLVSNNFHSAQVAASAKDLGVDKVDHAMKPAPFAVWRAIQQEGVPAEQTILVGDQVFTDVLAGKLAGIRTVLVDPQSTTDLWYTHIFRIFEGLALKGAPYHA